MCLIFSSILFAPFRIELNIIVKFNIRHRMKHKMAHFLDRPEFNIRTGVESTGAMSNIKKRKFDLQVRFPCIISQCVYDLGTSRFGHELAPYGARHLQRTYITKYFTRIQREDTAIHVMVPFVVAFVSIIHNNQATADD